MNCVNFLPFVIAVPYKHTQSVLFYLCFSRIESR